MKAARLPDGTVWPLPDGGDDDEYGLEWRLRYGKPTYSDLLCAASVLGAYAALIEKSQRRRNWIVERIKEAM